MSFIESLEKAGLLALNANYAKGSLIDSVSNTVGAKSGEIWWSRNGKIRGLQNKLASDGRITYAATTANSLANGECSIILFGNFNWRTNTTYPRLISKRTGITTDYNFEFTYNTTEGLTFTTYNSGYVTRTIATTIKNQKCIVLTLVNGAAAKLYKDGTYTGDFSGTSTINYPASTGLISISDYYTTGTNSSSGDLISRVILVSKALSADEISRIYEELSTGSIVGNCKLYNIHNTYIQAKTQPKLHWLLDRPIGNGLIMPDISGNGYNGTISQVGYSKGLLANTAAKFYGTGNGNINHPTALSILSANNSYTVSIWMYVDDILSAPAIFGGSSSQIYCQLTGNAVYWYTNGTAAVFGSLPNLQGNWHHFVFMKTGATSGKLFIDGVEQTLTSGSFVTTPTCTSVTIGGYSPNFAVYKLNGKLQDFRIYIQNLTKQEIDQLYYEGAKRLNVYIPMKSCTEVSLNYITTYGPIPNTPFIVKANAYNVVAPRYLLREYKDRKYIIYDGTGINYSQSQPIYFPSNQAFGTWIFRVKPPTGYGCHLAFIGDKQMYQASTGNTPSKNGTYFVYMEAGATPRLYFGKSNSAGNGTRLCQTNFSNDYNSVAITRNFKGVFTIYAKLGSANWVLLTASLDTNPTAADLTYTSGNEIELQLGQYQTYCHFGDFRFHEGVLSLDQIKTLYPQG